MTYTTLVKSKAPSLFSIIVLGNGTIELEEFMKLMASKQKEESDETSELREAFNLFDKDGNGFISAEELILAMKNLGEHLTDAEVNDMIKEADVNGDGEIDYDGMLIFKLIYALAVGAIIVLCHFRKITNAYHYM